ncbi:MAG: hypothetical protein HYT73_00215 [Candidatus Aenigmarchaeota archaeon]|nr:hypothetical protein [Candidatus Aenigmarchaeota archaeon]
MTEPCKNGNGYREDEGCLKVSLPYGHLFKAEGEAVGGGEELWKYTGLPYGMLNRREQDIGTPEGDGNGKSYVLSVSSDELKGLKYPTGDISRLILSIRAAQDVPGDVTRYGLGITGKDLLTDRLGLDIYEKPSVRRRFSLRGPAEDSAAVEEKWFRRELKDRGIYPIENLEYRPAHLVFAFMEELDIRNVKDVKTSLRIPVHGSRITIASEYPALAKLAMRHLAKMSNFDILPTTGKTESYALARDVDGIVEVVESGNTMYANGLRPVRPLVMDVTTPYFVVNGKTYDNPAFKDFIKELRRRLSEGREYLRDRMPELFEDKLNPSIFGDPEKDSDSEELCEELYERE